MYNLCSISFKTEQRNDIIYYLSRENISSSGKIFFKPFYKKLFLPVPTKPEQVAGMFKVRFNTIIASRFISKGSPHSRQTVEPISFNSCFAAFTGFAFNSV